MKYHVMYTDGAIIQSRTLPPLLSALLAEDDDPMIVYMGDREYRCFMTFDGLAVVPLAREFNVYPTHDASGRPVDMQRARDLRRLGHALRRFSHPLSGVLRDAMHRERLARRWA